MTTPPQSDPGEKVPFLYGISGLGVVYNWEGYIYLCITLDKAIS